MGCPYKLVSIDNLICYCTHDCVGVVIEESEAVVDKKRGPYEVSSRQVRPSSSCREAIEIPGVVIVEGA